MSSRLRYIEFVCPLACATLNMYMYVLSLAYCFTRLSFHREKINIISFSPFFFLSLSIELFKIVLFVLLILPDAVSHFVDEILFSIDTCFSFIKSTKHMWSHLKNECL